MGERVRVGDGRDTRVESERESEREIVGGGRGSGRGGERGMGMCVKDLESKGWERGERVGDVSLYL